MKNIFKFITALFLSGGLLDAAASTITLANSQSIPLPTAPVIIDRDANSQVWERTTYEQDPSGKIVPQIHHYIELATGLNYLKNGQWVRSEEKIDILPDGTAAATQGQHKVYFPGDIYNGVIEVVTPDGKHLKSRPLGLSYDDGNNTVLIAQLKDSVGQLVGPNQVVYPDAFTDFKADLVYTYRKGGFEQDVVLHEQPPTPESLGLNPQTTRLQLLTEFFNTPEPGKKANAKQKDGLQDTTLTFGNMKMIQGKAFSISQTPNARNQTPTYKSWQHLEGRTFLVEELPVENLAAQLNALPLPANTTAVNAVNSSLRKVSTSWVLPPMHLAQSSTNKMQLARADVRPKSGVVLDYVEVDSGQTDFTFQNDTTYYIYGYVELSGTTTIEDGAVIKYSPEGQINMDSVACQTSAYRPAIFTSCSDNTVGESVPGSSPSCNSTLNLDIQNDLGEDIYYWAVYDANGNIMAYENGSPAIASGDSTDTSFTANSGEPYYFDAWDTPDLNDFGGYFYPTLDNGTAEIGSDGSFNYSEGGDDLCALPPSCALSLPNGGQLHDLRFCNLTNVVIDTTANCSLTNVQFVNCGTAIQTMNASLYAGNILMSDIGTAFYGQHFHAHVEQMTLDQATLLTDDPDGGSTTSTLAMTNCLLTSISGVGVVPLTTHAVVQLSSGSGVYQSAGEGNYYLANGSPYRGAGTTNINSTLLAQLHQKTTWPPVVYFHQTIATNTLCPQVSPDTNATPDIGYHYGLLDYELIGASATNSPLTIFPGTTLSINYDTNTSDGFRVVGHLNCVGTPTQPITFIAEAIVQEQQSEAVNLSWDCPVVDVTNGTFQFSKFFSKSPLDPLTLEAANTLQNCEFYGGYELYVMSPYVINCLFVGFDYAVDWISTSTNVNIMRNNTFVNCGVVLDYSAGTVVASANFFDSSGVIDWTGSGATGGHNAFYNCTDDLGPTLSGLPGDEYAYPDFQSGPLGDYYLGLYDSLINAGDTNANKVGLYHFTMQANQKPETNSIVDIGYHYVALDSSGNPLDSNGDGMPDYLEDANGNGIDDGGETNWALAILIQPSAQSAWTGRNVTFDVTAGGVGPISYQWYFNGSAIAGATSAIWTLTNVQTGSAGDYSVVVSNLSGSVTSATASLSVSDPTGYTPLEGPLTNFVFEEDTTYYIKFPVSLYGTTTIEGGAVIKYSPIGQINMDSVVCQTGPYHPAIFTSCDDDSVGEPVPNGTPFTTNILSLHIQNDLGEDVYYWAVYGNGGTIVYENGSPAIASGDSIDTSFTANSGEPYYFDAWDTPDLNDFGGYFYPTLDNGTAEIGSDGSFNYSESGDKLSFPAPTYALSLPNGGQLHDLRFCNLTNVAIDTAGDCSLMNVQFVNCGTAVETTNASLYAGNILMSDVGTAFYGQHFHAHVEQMTLDQATLLTDDPDGGGTTSTLAMTNCLLTSVSGVGVVPLTTNKVFKLSSGSGVYQSAGEGDYYLVMGSPYRSAGTTNINSALLAQLYQKTTWPPVIYSHQTIAADTLSPQAPRDTNAAPDIGYHYDPLDYELIGASSTNSTLTILPGTTLGINFDANTSDGFYVSGPLTCLGTATQPITFIAEAIVQEQQSETFDLPDCPFVDAANGTFQFTKFFSQPQVVDVLASEAVNMLQNCEFYGGDELYVKSPYIINCLFVGLDYGIDWISTSTNVNIMRNNTFVNTGVVLDYSAGSVVASANLFDSGGVIDWTGPGATGGHNAFYNCSDMLGSSMSGLPGDKTLSSAPNYQSGTLGDYYLPLGSPLIDAGDTNAEQVGLYLFTTQTNQTVEGDSVVDIGYHYVATDANGNPLDLNNDGIADYLEDTNGYYPPCILIQPSNQMCVIGGNTSFSVTAGGTAPLHYQWNVNGTDIPDATNAMLTLTNVQLSQAGAYAVLVTNAFGAVLSSSAALDSSSAGLEIVLSKLIAWGDNNQGQTIVPLELSNVVAVAAGAYHTIALNADGTVTGWGYNANGQTNIPSGATNVVSIAAGAYHNLALRLDKTVVGWGNSAYGQVNSHIYSGFTNIMAIAAGDFHSLVLKTNGTVVAWGYNAFGQTNVPPDLTNVVAIAAGGNHNLALLGNGTVVAWGLNNWGQTNVPLGLSNVVAIAGGQVHSLALKNNGTVVAWGYNGHNECNVPSGLSNVVAIAAGRDDSLALKNDGTVVAWGYNAYGETNVPADVAMARGIAAGGFHNLALIATGGSGTYGSISIHPFVQSASVGTSVEFDAEVFDLQVLNNPPISYQWQFNDVNISGATSAVLTLSNVQLSQAGYYSVLVTYAKGSFLSLPALLTVH